MPITGDPGKSVIGDKIYSMPMSDHYLFRENDSFCQISSPHTTLSSLSTPCSPSLRHHMGPAHTTATFVDTSPVDHAQMQWSCDSDDYHCNDGNKDAAASEGSFGYHCLNSHPPQVQSEFNPTFYDPFETKHRRRTSRTQYRILEQAFQDNPKPSSVTRQELAEQLSMTPRGVQIWFQNRRAKAKQQATANAEPTGNVSGHSSDSRQSSVRVKAVKRRRTDSRSLHRMTQPKPIYAEWNSLEPLSSVTGQRSLTPFLHVTQNQGDPGMDMAPVSQTVTTEDNGISDLQFFDLSAAPQQVVYVRTPLGCSTALTNNGNNNNNGNTAPPDLHPFSRTIMGTWSLDREAMDDTSPMLNYPSNAFDAVLCNNSATEAGFTPIWYGGQYMSIDLCNSLLYSYPYQQYPLYQMNSMCR